MSSQDNISSIEVSCHCGSNKFSFPVTLPLENDYKDVHACLCTLCRLQTGSLCGNFIKAPSPPFDPDGPVPVTMSASKTTDFATRYFCNTCSSQLFFRYSLPELTTGPSNGFWLASGCAELPAGEKFGVDYVGFLKNTPDAGMASWMTGHGLKIRRTFQGVITDEDVAALEATAMSQFDVPETLEGRCQCSNVKLSLSRQTGAEEELPPNTWSDNTDLVIPEWTPADKKPPIDEKNPWWIRDALEPGMGKRFLGGLCTCTSCRKVSGMEVQAWLFTPSVCVKVIKPNGEKVEWPTREELLNPANEWREIFGVYKSTQGDPGVIRTFCKKCGANISWDGFTRKNFIDLSAGLFSERGTKEEGWIEWWTERVSYVEDSSERTDIGHILETGLKTWKERLGGKV